MSWTVRYLNKPQQRAVWCFRKKPAPCRATFHIQNLVFQDDLYRDDNSSRQDHLLEAGYYAPSNKICPRQDHLLKAEYLAPSNKICPRQDHLLQAGYYAPSNKIHPRQDHLIQAGYLAQSNKICPATGMPMC